VIDILVKVGDPVTEGMVVASIEAMKAQHDIKAPCAGTVSSVDARIGEEIDQSKPILTIS
jgi:biotin carboxyl carrier protein